MYAICNTFENSVERKKQAGKFSSRPQSIDKVDALPSKVCKQSFDGNINLL